MFCQYAAPKCIGNKTTFSFFSRDIFFLWSGYIMKLHGMFSLHFNDKQTRTGCSVRVFFSQCYPRNALCFPSEKTNSSTGQNTSGVVGLGGCLLDDK